MGAVQRGGGLVWVVWNRVRLEFDRLERRGWLTFWCLDTWVLFANPAVVSSDGSVLDNKGRKYNGLFAESALVRKCGKESPTWYEPL